MLIAEYEYTIYNNTGDRRPRAINRVSAVQVAGPMRIAQLEADAAEQGQAETQITQRCPRWRTSHTLIVKRKG